MTPDFLVYRCLEQDYRDIRAADVYIAGQVLSPFNTDLDIEAKKVRYAGAGIPLYWEVLLGREPRRITVVRAYVLETGHARIPAGITPLYPANYVVAAECTSADTDGITFDYPFPIRIPWSELEF